MRRIAARSSTAIVLLAALLAGCGSFKLPFRMGPELSPDEMSKKYGESAKYLLNEPEPKPGTAAAQQPGQPPAGGKFDVAPELVRPAPIRQAAASTTAVPMEAPPASRYGDLLFVSGQLPRDGRGNVAAGDSRIEEQARLALDNVRSVLESNRLTMANVVSITVYLRDLNDLRGFDAVYATYFKGALPARSVVEVSRLPLNARVEVSAVAGR